MIWFPSDFQIKSSIYHHVTQLHLSSAEFDFLPLFYFKFLAQYFHPSHSDYFWNLFFTFHFFAPILSGTRCLFVVEVWTCRMSWCSCQDMTAEAFPPGPGLSPDQTCEAGLKPCNVNAPRWSWLRAGWARPLSSACPWAEKTRADKIVPTLKWEVWIWLRLRGFCSSYMSQNILSALKKWLLNNFSLAS